MLGGWRKETRFCSCIYMLPCIIIRRCAVSFRFGELPEKDRYEYISCPRGTARPRYIKTECTFSPSKIQTRSDVICHRRLPRRGCRSRRKAFYVQLFEL